MSEPQANMPNPTPADELRSIDAYWRAANYLSVGQIYLVDNPLLKTPLQKEHIKRRLVGHWGTTPGTTLTAPKPRHHGPKATTPPRSLGGVIREPVSQSRLQPTGK
jgi:phosphoketolase